LKQNFFPKKKEKKKIFHKKRQVDNFTLTKNLSMRKIVSVSSEMIKRRKILILFDKNQANFNFNLLEQKQLFVDGDLKLRFFLWHE
jgi:hypothetical protein